MTLDTRWWFDYLRRLPTIPTPLRWWSDGKKEYKALDGRVWTPELWEVLWHELFHAIRTDEENLTRKDPTKPLTKDNIDSDREEEIVIGLLNDLLRQMGLLPPWPERDPKDH